MIDLLPQSLQVFLDADKNGDLYLDESEGIKLGLTFTQMEQIDALDQKDGRISPQEYLEFKRLYYEPVKWSSVVSAGRAMFFADGRQWRFKVSYLLNEKGISEDEIEQILTVLDRISDPAKRDEIAGHIVNMAEDGGEYYIFDRINDAELDEEAFLNGVRLFAGAMGRGEAGSEARANFFRCLNDMDTLWKGLKENEAILKENGLSEEECGQYRRVILNGVADYEEQERYEMLGVAGWTQNLIFRAAEYRVVDGADKIADEAREPADLLQLFRSVGIAEDACQKLCERYSAYVDHDRIAGLVSAMKAAGLSPKNISGFLFKLSDAKAVIGGRGIEFMRTEEDDEDASEPRNAILFKRVIDDITSALDTLKNGYGVGDEELFSTLLDIVPEACLFQPLSKTTSILDVGKFLSAAKAWGWSLGEVKDFHKVLWSLGIDEGEVYQMIANSGTDKGYGPEEVLNLVANAANKCRVTHFGRLSLKVLEAAARPRRANRPLAVISMAGDDWNGAFRGLHHDIDDFIEQGYDIDLREVNTEDDIYDQFAGVGMADAWLLAGHGEPKGVRLGKYSGKDGYELKRFDTTDTEAAEKIKPHLSKDAKIVFIACSTAAEPEDGSDSLAQTMTGLLDRPIWANMMDGGLNYFKFDDEGSVGEVSFWGRSGDGHGKWNDSSGTLVSPK